MCFDSIADFSTFSARGFENNQEFPKLSWSSFSRLSTSVLNNGVFVSTKIDHMADFTWPTTYVGYSLKEEEPRQ